MNLIRLLPVGKVDVLLLQTLRSAIHRCLPYACEILTEELNPDPAYHVERLQYHSSEILQRMQALSRHVIFETLPNPPRRKRLGKRVLGLI